ncbi:hypothetical protein CEXT_627971 [Caerostris extrusa]|uniref:Uncharacterized protein n=1 Tax=Caerostris extrusa TaxID=172846 RepID=A0AAV4WDS1_CAEEX|nr:hypothetical protein CEXT_627971 [Caerostris extrusa]
MWHRDRDGERGAANDIFRVLSTPIPDSSRNEQCIGRAANSANRYATHSLVRRLHLSTSAPSAVNEIEFSLRLRLGQTSFRDESEDGVGEGGKRTLKMSLAASPLSIPM